jgi:P-type Cu2+ transporter
VPSHVCDPMAEPDPVDWHIAASAAYPEAAGAALTVAPAREEHGAHEMATGEGMPSPHEMMGHGGQAGVSMAAMVRDMRNRFVVAALLSVPILLWSSIGRNVLGFTVAAPFGLRDDVWLLLLSLPVIFYSAWIFFDGAVRALRALRARTLDMMVLVAVAIGAGWLYSLVVTLTGGGDTFYEAAAVLAAFVLLGHWFEMRARGGANDAIRALLDLAPPRATVIRDGAAVEIPTAEVAVGDLLLVRPGDKVGADGVVEEGQSEVDESVVTGESLPVSKGPGAATLLTWLLAGQPLARAMLFAITVVVITCPDALGLATPTAIMVGTRLGAKRGILVKNAMALETSARIQAVVMDKAGRLTKGEPEVTDLVVGALPEREILRLAAAVERESEHPLAEAVVTRADGLGVPVARAEGFENVPGYGALARVDGRRVAVGNARPWSVTA